MPSVVLPRSFFVAERDQAYSNWFESFWRELVSNCDDAGATAIKIKTIATIHRGEPVFRIAVQDNGSGMDLDTIENVYMRLGASTKTGDDGQVGGFGRARILTSLSHLRYSIASGEHIVDGEGASYEVRKASKPIKGCGIVVDVEPRYAARLQEGLFTFLETSSLRAKVALDLADKGCSGEQLRGIPDAEPGRPVLWKNRFYAGKSLSTFSDEKGVWADISVNKGSTAKRHLLVVRVNGIAMHTEHLSEPIQVTVDLVPSRSREAMTASRDQLRWEFRRSLMTFVQRLAADVMGATRRKEERREVKLQGRQGGLLLTRKAALGQSSDVREPSGSDSSIAHSHPRGDTPLESDVREILEEDSPAGLLRYDFSLITEDPTPEQRRALSRYNPESWSRRAANGEPGGYNAQRLLALWTEAMRVSVNRLYELGADMPAEVRLRCGFILSGSSLAQLQQCEDGSYNALLNPVDDKGRAKYRAGDPQDRKRVALIAMHEACHLLVDLHNEYFANLLTELAGSFRDIDLDRSLRLAVEDVGSELKELRQLAPAASAENGLSLN